MKLFFPAVFTKESEGYSTAVPDLDGCFSEGDTFIEAYQNTQNAIKLYLEGIKEEIKPSVFENIKFDSTKQFICVIEIAG